MYVCSAPLKSSQVALFQGSTTLDLLAEGNICVVLDLAENELAFITVRSAASKLLTGPGIVDLAGDANPVGSTAGDTSRSHRIPADG